MYRASTWQGWRLLRTNCSPIRRSLRTATDDADLKRLLRPPSCASRRWTHQDAPGSVASDEAASDHQKAWGQVSSKEARQRLEELSSYGASLYPVFQRGRAAVSLRDIHRMAKPSQQPGLEGQNEVDEETQQRHARGYTILGRITAIRKVGAKLMFFDIVQGRWKVQLVLNFTDLERSMQAFDGAETVLPVASVLKLRRGDNIAVRARRPYTAKNGVVSIFAAQVPVLQSPCLQRFPVQDRGSATRQLAESNHQPRHVEMLTDPEVVDTMLMRHSIIQAMRQFFERRGFIEVSTPILSALAGGATAKPFATTATEFPGRKLSLRIAPELWLKRLVIGGLARVYEIGPSFRNEGLDKTHNPEFTTCEFYAVGHDLSLLMQNTEQMLGSVVTHLFQSQSLLKDPVSEASFSPFQQGMVKRLLAKPRVIDFIPSLNAALGIELPDLSSARAHSSLLSIFHSKNIPLPSNPTVPRLVDSLSSLYLETQSENELVWIINMPECLSPLAKSFLHPLAPNEQRVALRAELFFQGKELVNCYEEENSPFEQRRKFENQQVYARPPASDADQTAGSSGQPVHDQEAMKVDEDYLQALEWGLPPTGGWGCGIDRLVMILLGKERIGDVLSFGSLRAVTRTTPPPKASKQKQGNSLVWRRQGERREVGEEGVIEDKESLIKEEDSVTASVKNPWGNQALQ